MWFRLSFTRIAGAYYIAWLPRGRDMSHTCRTNNSSLHASLATGRADLGADREIAYASWQIGTRSLPGLMKPTVRVFQAIDDAPESRPGLKRSNSSLFPPQ